MISRLSIPDFVRKLPWASGLCLMIGSLMLSLGGPSAPAVWLMAASFTVSSLDVLAILLILPHWRADVPSVLTAIAIRRGRSLVMVRKAVGADSCA